MDIDEIAFEMIDALGVDFVQLAPPDEAHFDSRDVARAVVLFVLAAVGAGIHDGIKEWTKDETVEVLDSVSHQISERLQPEAVTQPYIQIPTECDLNSARDAAERQLAAAREATCELEPTFIPQIAQVGGSTVRISLESMGLAASAGERLQRTVDEQLTTFLSP